MNDMDGVQRQFISEFDTEASQRYAACDSNPLSHPCDALAGVPPFLPARGLASPHAQTAWATLFPRVLPLEGTTERRLRLDDGDLIVLHDDCPQAWRRGDHVVLMLHGLGGSHRSGYMMRLAARLQRRGVRAFRMDHRGCGAGTSLAKNPYHAGRVEDLAAAVQMIERLCPGSPISIAGFSLSGNLLLRYLGEYSEKLPLSLFRAVAVCPPIDLQHCASMLGTTRMGQRYDLYFARRLVRQLSNSIQWRDDVPLANTNCPPRRLYDFDELYTAPASGFESADHYYSRASARPVLGQIRVHTTILASLDDPVVSTQAFRGVEFPPNVRLCLTQHGGHLGFVGRRGVDPDRRWMDWRLLEWLLN